MSTLKTEEQIADYLKVLGSPVRIQILYSLGSGEACVCHLEALLQKRQAYISQHLMVMRDAGILDTRRDGKFIFYRVADKDLFELLQSTAAILKIRSGQLLDQTKPLTQPGCECPKCQTDV